VVVNTAVQLGRSKEDKVKKENLNKELQITYQAFYKIFPKPEFPFHTTRGRLF
jgi:hypothetical protein